MKKRLAAWLIKKLLHLYDVDEVVDEYKTRINKLISVLYDTYPPSEHKKLDIEIKDYIFNAKYTKYCALLGLTTLPSEELSKMYALANKGDNSYITTSLHRLLVKKKDKEVLNLRYRLSLNQ